MSTHEAYGVAAAIVNACWLIFVMFWLIAAFGNKKTVYSENLGQRFLVQIIALIGVLIIMNSPREPQPLSMFIIPQTAATAAIATMICIAGLAFAIWARVAIGRNWSARVTVKENHELIQRGPYALVRHPIYTGLLSMALGSALLVGRAGAAAGWIVFLVSFWIKSRDEEALMMQQFPNEYAAYRQRTKRVVPFVW